MTDIVVPSAGGTTSIPFDSLFTSTIANYDVKQLHKSFLENRPSVRIFMDDFGHRDSGGGIFVQGSAAYGQNTAVQFFTGAESFSQEVSQTALPLVYRWQQIACPVSVTRVELAQNRGAAKLFDLMESRVKQSMYSINAILGQENFSDGTNYAGNTIIGLAAGISTTPSSNPASGALGGLTSATPNQWWRNNAVTSFGSFAVHGVNGSTDDVWLHTWNLCSDGSANKPTNIISDQLTLEYYNRTLTQIARIVDPTKSKTGDLTFDALTYMGRPWEWDRQCPTGRAYFVNSNDMYYMLDPDMLFEWTKPLQMPYQLAYTRIVALRLAMVYWSRMFMAVIDGITA